MVTDMTAYKPVYIECDIDGCGREYESGLDSVREARLLAREDGWVLRKGSARSYDLCPAHRNTFAPELRARTAR